MRIREVTFDFWNTRFTGKTDSVPKQLVDILFAKSLVNYRHYLVNRDG